MYLYCICYKFLSVRVSIQLVCWIFFLFVWYKDYLLVKLLVLSIFLFINNITTSDGFLYSCSLLPLALTFCATSLLPTYILRISSWYWHFGSGFATWWNIDGLARMVEAWLPLQRWKVVSLPPPPTRLLPTWTARSPPGWRTACRPTPHVQRRQPTSGRAAESLKGESVKILNRPA